MTCTSDSVYTIESYTPGVATRWRVKQHRRAWTKTLAGGFKTEDEARDWWGSWVFGQMRAMATRSAAIGGGKVGEVG